MLVQLVLKEQKPLCKISKNLKIKLSTAKMIITKYKETGTFFNKRIRNLRRFPLNSNQNPSKNIMEMENNEPEQNH